MKKLFSTKVSENALSFALFLLRVGFGSLMLVNHGLGKLMKFSILSRTFTDPFGIGSTTSLALTIFAEFFCAAFIVLGLFTRLAAIPLVIAMSVAFFMAHNMNYKSGPGGGEPALLFLIVFITLLIAGPGKASLDRLINK
jgi:putative oxidoreductase